jgi:nitrogen permease regulator 3-like protein
MNEEFDSTPSEHSALLLLEDAETLLKEIEGDSKEFSVPLAFFIRNLTPTKSLKKLSVLFSISLVDLQIFAGHLIYWRRARAIPPLHPRDTYIVSPNADMSALSLAIHAYAVRFPMLPSLPKMLSELSRGTPRPYRTLFPSPVHRNVYMEILAWLMRGGWVTQLRTYAWVRVSAEVKSEVDTIIRHEKEEKQREKERREKEEALNSARLESSDDSIISPRHSPSASDDDHEVLSQIASPLLTASDSGSMSSHRTAIPVQSSSRPTSPTAIIKQPPHTHLSQPMHRPSPLQSIQNTSTNSDLSSETSSPVQPMHPQPAKMFSPSLIRSPQLANALESRWLEHIGSVHLQDSAEAKELWPTLLGYLDGRHALEELAPREGLKRKNVAAAVGQLREGGWLTSVRHW